MIKNKNFSTEFYEIDSLRNLKKKLLDSIFLKYRRPVFKDSELGKTNFLVSKNIQSNNQKRIVGPEFYEIDWSRHFLKKKKALIVFF